MKGFDYIRPDSMVDAMAALREKDNPCLLAGGTDLLIGMKTNTVRPRCVIDLKGVPDIDRIEYNGGFKIGALATTRDIEVSPLLREKIPALSEAAATLGSIQIRNRATVGGNLCHGSPAADMAAILLAMDGQAKIVSDNGEKTIGLEQFFTGPNRTALGEHDILAQIVIPEKMAQFKGVYLKHGPRKAMDIGIVNIAIVLDADFKSGMCNQIRVALGAVAPTPIRAKKAEALLNGNELKPDLIDKAAATAAGETNPITDFRASAGYRKDLVKNLVARGIHQILASNITG
jgi:carbon-monoxide dehydrogenase medium subunit